MSNRASYQHIPNIQLGSHHTVRTIVSVTIARQSNLQFPWSVSVMYANNCGETKNFTSKRRAFAYAASFNV